MRSVHAMSSPFFLATFSSSVSSFTSNSASSLSSAARNSERHKPSLDFLGLSLFALGFICELFSECGNVVMESQFRAYDG